MLGNRPNLWIADWLCKWKLIIHVIIFMLTIIVLLDFYRAKHLYEKTEVSKNKEIRTNQSPHYGDIMGADKLEFSRKVHEAMIDQAKEQETAAIELNDATDHNNISDNTPIKLDTSNRVSNLSSDKVDAELLSRLPGAIIIGARKCGTRALLKFLELNPKVKVAQNEIHFFDKTAQYSKGLGWYRSQMPPSDVDDVTVEKSPAYFITSVVPQRVKEMNPTIKLILIVRDPVVRLISDYTQVLANRMLPNRSAESDSESFERYITRSDGGINVNLRAIKTGMYAIYLEHWRKYFDQSQMLIVEGERLIRSPYDELKKVESFLGVPPRIKRDHFIYNETKGFYCIRQLDSPSILGRVSSTINTTIKLARPRPATKCLSPSKGRKHIKVGEDLTRRLRQLYYPFNQYFYSMIGERLDWPE